MSKALALAETLLREPSITPFDANCQNILIERLEKMAFKIEKMQFGEVNNFYARRGLQEPILLFAGHTDVVPPGPLEKWVSPPFEPTIREGLLYGRGAADMKSSLAAMVCACEEFLKKYPEPLGSIAFLVTSDEEGDALDGTKQVVERLIKRKEKITWCIVGEASSEEKLGDTIKIGRRGSLNGKLHIYGKQGHIAYPQKADNPIHKSFQALHALSSKQWDNGSTHFSPTCFQVSNIYAGTGANNVIPSKLEVVFNFRYGTANTSENLKKNVSEILDNYQLNYHIDWSISGEPFLSHTGKLFEASCLAIKKIVGIEPKASTEGGTSDGRFIIKMGCEVIEIGPLNASIHQINEHIAIQELECLTSVYYEILISLIGKPIGV
jgi:succinyl-diaminopimelate desuccinylase